MIITRILLRFEKEIRFWLTHCDVSNGDASERKYALLCYPRKKVFYSTDIQVGIIFITVYNRLEWRKITQRVLWTCNDYRVRVTIVVSDSR